MITKIISTSLSKKTLKYYQSGTDYYKKGLIDKAMRIWQDAVDQETIKKKGFGHKYFIYLNVAKYNIDRIDHPKVKTIIKELNKNCKEKTSLKEFCWFVAGFWYLVNNHENALRFYVYLYGHVSDADISKENISNAADVITETYKQTAGPAKFPEKMYQFRAQIKEKNSLLYYFATKSLVVHFFHTYELGRAIQENHLVLKNVRNKECRADTYASLYTLYMGINDRKMAQWAGCHLVKHHKKYMLSKKDAQGPFIIYLYSKSYKETIAFVNDQYKQNKISKFDYYQHLVLVHHHYNMFEESIFVMKQLIKEFANKTSQHNIRRRLFYTYMSLADYYINNEKNKTAINEYKNALKLADKHNAYMVNAKIGFLYFGMDQYKKAKEHLEKAMKDSIVQIKWPYQLYLSFVLMEMARSETDVKKKIQGYEAIKKLLYKIGEELDAAEINRIKLPEYQKWVIGKIEQNKTRLDLEKIKTKYNYEFDREFDDVAKYTDEDVSEIGNQLFNRFEKVLSKRDKVLIEMIAENTARGLRNSGRLTVIEEKLPVYESIFASLGIKLKDPKKQVAASVEKFKEEYEALLRTNIKGEGNMSSLLNDVARNEAIKKYIDNKLKNMPVDKYRNKKKLIELIILTLGSIFVPAFIIKLMIIYMPLGQSIQNVEDSHKELSNIIKKSDSKVKDLYNMAFIKLSNLSQEVSRPFS
ncbi:hypothetical protein ACFL5G_02805 [Candidatus Margulisiibacteriota bacterium]